MVASFPGPAQLSVYCKDEARYVVYIVYQLVCNDYPLCILLNNLIALFVHLHVAYLSVYLVTGVFFFSLNSYLFPPFHFLYISISLSIVV